MTGILEALIRVREVRLDCHLGTPPELRRSDKSHGGEEESGNLNLNLNLRREIWDMGRKEQGY